MHAAPASGTATPRPPRVLIVGGGYVGLYCALELERALAPGEADVTLVSPDNFMLFWPLLPEVASGTVEPRHVAVPLRKVLERTRLLAGRVTALDRGARVATVEPYADEELELPYDQVVLGLGSITHMPPIPGLAQRARGFKSIADAIDLRNHVLACLEAAEAAPDREARARSLTFAFVGGGYTGVEALGELEDMARDACRYFPTLEPRELRWVLVEATDRILPEVDRDLAEYALEALERRGVEVRLGCQLQSAEDALELSDGDRLDADTLVWAAGVRPHPAASELGLPVDDRGRLVVDETLRLRDGDAEWAAGDVAAVPDIEQGGTCPPTAQHALREARRLGRNVAGSLRGERPAPFRYRSPGELVTLGRMQGVGRVAGRRLRGRLPWLLRRGYYWAAMPSANRRARVLADWSIGIPFHHDVVQLAPMSEAREELSRTRT